MLEIDNPCKAAPRPDAAPTPLGMALYAFRLESFNSSVFAGFNAPSGVPMAANPEEIKLDESTTHIAVEEIGPEVVVRVSVKCSSHV
jgi:hypothetical protein